MDKKYVQENFSIENLSTKQVEKLINKKAQKSEFWQWIKNKHEIKYISSYLGVLLLSDKSQLFMKGTKVYDLFNMYYMDFEIKNHLLIICQKIERCLKVSMLAETDGVFKPEFSKTFGAKVDFFKKKDLDESYKNKIIRHFESIINTRFKDVDDFYRFLAAVKRIRNFSAHSYNIANHYDWHTEFAHRAPEVAGSASFRDDFKQLMRGTTNRSIEKLRKLFINIFENKHFSTNEISSTVSSRYLGTKTIYSLEWDEFLDKPDDKFNLSDFLNANSRFNNK